jgi:hypothetical protein
MNKATFGLVGNDERPDASAEKEAKAERKAREKEERQQREAEKRARRDEEKARKAAEKEEKSQQAGAKPKRGLMDRMTFGMIGGRSESDEANDQEKLAKAEAKKRERAEKEEKKKAEKTAKQEKEAEERAAKSDAEQARAEEKETGEKRGWMDRMTFGLAGGDKKSDEDKDQEKLAKAEAKEKARAEKEARKQQEREEKQAKAAEKREAKEQKAAGRASDNAESDVEGPGEKRSMMSRMTFGLVGGKKEKTEEVVEPDSPAEAASVETSQPEVSEAAGAKETATEPAVAEGTPKEKRGLMSRMTFGLVGGGDKKDMHEEMPVGGESGAASAVAQPALSPEQLAMAAPTNVAYDVQPASAMGTEERKLAKLPFKTVIDLSTKSASGRPQATASRETYSRAGYGITDIGDVRIAVKDMTFNNESRAGGIVISSDDRAPAGGKSGIGNESFVFEYARGVTACTFGSVQFTISKSVINIGGKSIPIGQGRKLVVVDQQGNVLGAYAAD